MTEPVRILLNDGSEALVDPEFSHLVGRLWTVAIRGNVRYAVTRILSQNRYLHHIVVPDCPPGHERDHKNGNGLDCRRSNLRVVPKRINQRNHSRPSGVSRKRDKWRAYYWDGDKQRSLGVFPTEAAARQARLAWERIHWGVQPQREYLHGAG